MKRKYILIVSLGLLTILILACGGDSHKKLLVGRWEAEYYAGKGNTDKFAFEFKKNLFGKISGKVEASRNQNNLPDSRMKNVVFDFPEISFNIPKHHCQFKGKLNPPSGTISGKFYYTTGQPSRRLTFRKQ